MLYIANEESDRILQVDLISGEITPFASPTVPDGPSECDLSPNLKRLAVIFSGGDDWYNSMPNNLCVFER